LGFFELEKVIFEFELGMYKNIIESIFSNKAEDFFRWYSSQYQLRFIFLLCSFCFLCLVFQDTERQILIALAASVYLDIFAVDTWVTRSYNRPAKPFCEACNFSHESIANKSVFLINYLLFVLMLIGASLR